MLDRRQGGRLVESPTMSGFEPPVLFLIFNRPELTARVFETIRRRRPRRLYVAADGPRPDRPDDARLCAEARRIATAADWSCEVRTLFRETNLGCGAGVSGALTWFFNEVEEGIILEDDCLPHPDFFRFCAAMLERHRHDRRVLSVAGTHFLPASFACRHSHYFSRYAQIWGWAAWRRTWQLYDFTLTSLTEEQWNALFRELCPTAIEQGFLREILHSLLAGNVDTWDFQLVFSCFKARGLHVVPGGNLITNIGYTGAATHTHYDGVLANQAVQPLSPRLDAEVPVEADAEVDSYIFFVRFLERLSQTWWVEQVISPERKLGDTRIELGRTERRLRQLEREMAEKRRQLLLATRALARAEARGTAAAHPDAGSR